MFQASTRDQIADRDQRLNHSFIGITLFTLFGDDALAFKAGGFFGLAAFIINGERNARVDAALR